MKNIDNYINEKLLIDVEHRDYEYFPTTKEELQNIIKERILNEGFNCDLNDIDTSEIEDMSSLFTKIPIAGINKFNGDVSKWDVRNVKNMKAMFRDCYFFDGDLSDWNVYSVEDMSFMFYGCLRFTGKGTELWDVESVKNMEYMFTSCRKFNGNISDWNTKNVENMADMFQGCVNFNCNLSKWNIESLKLIDNMFYGCSKLDGAALENWRLPKRLNTHHLMTGSATKPSWCE